MKTILFLIFIGISLLSGSDTFGEGKPIYVLNIDGMITPSILEYVEQGLEQCETNDAECLIICLNTPGGMVSTTWPILQRLLNAQVATVVYVYPKGASAASAGTFITYAAHIAVMSPATNIGAAHVVTLLGGNEEEKESSHEDALEKVLQEMKLLRKQTPTASNAETTPIPATPSPAKTTKETLPVSEAKMMNEALAKLKAIAQERHRNIQFAHDAIVDSKAITEQEALEMGVINFVCKDIDELIKVLNGVEVSLPKGAKKLDTLHSPVVHMPMNWRQRFFQTLSDPNIVFLLITLGITGLIAELKLSGAIFPGVIGAVCLILAYVSLQHLPFSYGGLFLIMLAFLLFLLEIKIQSFGFLTLGGMASLILGALLLFDSPNKLFRVSLTYVLPIALAIGGIMGMLVFLVIKSLKTKPITGNEGLAGTHGVARDNLQPDGYVIVHGELWRAYAHDFIPQGAPVIVERVEGLVLWVKRSEF